MKLVGNLLSVHDATFDNVSTRIGVIHHQAARGRIYRRCALIDDRFYLQDAGSASLCSHRGCQQQGRPWGRVGVGGGGGGGGKSNF